MPTPHTSQVERSGTADSTAQAEAAPITIGNLLRAAALTAVVVAAANLLVYLVAGLLWDVPGEFSALNPISIVVVSVLAVAFAALSLALLVRFTRRALPTYVALGVLGTLVSLSGPLQAMAGAIPDMPEATTATGITMIVLHILTGILIIRVLPVLARR